MDSATLRKLVAANIIQQSCEFLDWESLLQFGITSKLCYSIASKYLNQTITISVLSGAELKDEIEYWTSKLERTASFRHVRRAKVIGYMPSEIEYEIEGTKAYRSKLLCQSKKSDVDKHEDSSIWVSEQTPWYPHVRGSPFPIQTAKEDKAWQPLAIFIRQLFAITDLIYACNDQFPPCLLRMLEEHRPQCRIHLKTFCLRSLTYQNTDPHEFRLVTSPLLHSISVLYSTVNGDGTQDFHEEAALRVTSWLAPNLKEVRLSAFVPADTRALREGWNRDIVRPWQGFSLDTQKSCIKQAKLCVFESKSYTDQTFLERWSRSIDFSTLSVLKLSGTIKANALRWAASHGRFNSLTALSLVVNQKQVREWPVYSIEDPSIFAAQFLSSLPALKNLQVTGKICDRILTAILGSHGTSLQQLHLTSDRYGDKFLFDNVQVCQIQQRCPHLEEVTLSPVPRSKGDRHETSIYKSLGALKKLRRATLTLDSSKCGLFSSDESQIPNESQVPSDPTFDDFDNEFIARRRGYQYPRNGHVRDALINSAMDETLARAIFDCIANSKGKNRVPLEYLKLHSVGGGEFSGASEIGLKGTLRCLSQDWILRRSTRDDSRDKVIAKDITKYVSSSPAWPRIEPIFRRLWPAMEGGASDWRKEWRSWPLDMSEH